MNAGKAVKVSISLHDGATRHGAPTYSAILDYLFYRGVEGATALRGVAGFGPDRHMHSAASVELSDRLPIRVEFVATSEKVEELLPRLQELAGGAPIEVQEISIVAPQPPQAKAHGGLCLPERLRIAGPARMMRLLIGEEERWRDRPLHEALVEAMRANDIAGVTVYRGIAGYSHLRPEAGLRHGSILLVAVDEAAKLEAFLPILEQMVGEGMAVFSDVDVVKYSFRAPEPHEQLETLA